MRLILEVLRYNTVTRWIIYQGCILTLRLLFLLVVIHNPLLWFVSFLDLGQSNACKIREILKLRDTLIQVLSSMIALKFYTHLHSSAAQAPVKYQSYIIILILHFIAQSYSLHLVLSLPPASVLLDAWPPSVLPSCICPPPSNAPSFLSFSACLFLSFLFLAVPSKKQ